MATIIRARRIKTTEEILSQLERIFNLYSKGYGSGRMLQQCDERVYIIITRITY